MSRGMIASVVCLAVLGLAAAAWRALPARADGTQAAASSVLVTLTRLKRGTLPHVVAAYGTVRASNSGGKVLMAPESAVVGVVDAHLGQQVRAGAPLVTLLPSPQTSVAYQQAKSALMVAKDLVKSTRRLFTLHLATTQQLAQARKAESDARVTLHALHASGAGGAYMLRAPFESIVTALSVHSGDIVVVGSPMLTLAAPSRLVLSAGVVPAQAREVHAGDRATVKAAGSDHWVSARVAVGGAAANLASVLVPVQIALPPGKFLPGEVAEARIVTAEVLGYVVPHRAILVNDSGTPYVVQALNGIAHKVPVRILDSDTDENVIAGALDPHAALVLTGNYQLEDGMRIRLADPPPQGGG